MIYFVPNDFKRIIKNSKYGKLSFRTSLLYDPVLKVPPLPAYIFSRKWDVFGTFSTGWWLKPVLKVL